jgi:hypothetical protein
MIDHCDGAGRTGSSRKYDTLDFVYFVTEHGTLLELQDLPIQFFLLQFRYRI